MLHVTCACYSEGFKGIYGPRCWAGVRISAIYRIDECHSHGVDDGMVHSNDHFIDVLIAFLEAVTREEKRKGYIRRGYNRREAVTREAVISHRR